MEILVKDSGRERVAPLPAGTYFGVCCSIIGMGTTYNPAFGKKQAKVLFVWELPDERIEIDGESVPRTISETYTMSLSEKSNLRKMLEGWRGVPFTPEELKGFGLSRVLGKQCLVSTLLKQKQDGSEFAKITGITRVPRGMFAENEASNELTIWDISNPNATLDDVKQFPEWIQKRIEESDEYQNLLTPTVAQNTSPIIAPAGADLPF